MYLHATEPNHARRHTKAHRTDDLQNQYAGRYREHALFLSGKGRAKMKGLRDAVYQRKEVADWILPAARWTKLTEEIGRYLSVFLVAAEYNYDATPKEHVAVV